MPKNGFHTYAELKEIVERGESVRFNGRLISSVDDLPSKAEVARITGDKAEAAASLDDIEKQRKKLDADEKALRASIAADEAAAKKKAEADAKADADAKK